jgi:class 3 adenylate cyclase/tetratricopeptide (TPR) repeat protein
MTRYARFVLLCKTCGHESLDEFRFCPACGAELQPAVVQRELRKTVTVVFCDVTGSTALGEQLDPEALRRTMGRYFDEIRTIVERHGGTVEKFIGDAAMAIFGVPVSHEDDALRAVRAAAEIRDRLATLGRDLTVALSFRTGVNTGEVVVGEGETLATGDAVNVAARLEQAAAPAEILIGAETLALVRDAVTVEEVEPLTLKGKREPVPAFRLVDVDATADAFSRHLDAPLVGRVREQQRLRADFEGVISERVCHMFTLLGPAGVGKSRLVAEFLATADDTVDILRSRCLHYGEDITYWPLVEILLAIGVEPGEVIGSSPAETQLAFRKLLEARAAERPQIVLLDDIQWAEPLFLDLVEHIADWSRDAPILLLCVARPDLLELRPGWGGGKLNATTILLEALSGDDCELLISRLTDGAQLTDGMRRRILQAADGNPLFIEEMLAMVSEDGSDADVVVPPTIQALLQSRLDRLGVGERDMIGRGAVEGQVFHRGSVRELAPEPERDDVAVHLLSLVRKELIRPEQPTFPDEEAFRFRHLLIRDAAYDSLPKATRAELHERFAEWLDRHAALVEQDEIVGYHLERACRNRAELDADDPRLEGLARRAATRLEAAARGAESRGDVPAMCGLLQRASDLLPEGDRQRLETILGLAYPLNQAGRRGEARAVAAELAASSEPRFQAFALLAESVTDVYAGEFALEREKARIDAAREIFEGLNDKLGLAWTERSEWGLHWMSCRAVAATAAARRAEGHARAAGHDVLAESMRSTAQRTLAAGPAHVDEAMQAAEEMIAEATGSVGRALAGRTIGKLLAMQGKIGAAREQLRHAHAGLREAGLLVEAAAGAQQTFFVELRAGALGAAERALRDGIEELDRLGNPSYRGTTALMLADVLASRGAYDEASRYCSDVRETMSEDDLTDVIAVDALEGFLAATAGAHTEGERLSHRAIELAEPIDVYDHKARAYEWQARTLALVGKPEEAREAATTALSIYESKGDQPAAAWARRLIASIEG